MEQVPASKPVAIIDYENYLKLLSASKELEQLKSEQAEFPTLLDEVFLPTHTYEGKPYAVIAESKIKVGGIIDKFMAHPLLKPTFDALNQEQLAQLRKVWLPVTIYETRYDNPEGKTWVRMKEEFDHKFQPINK